MCKNYHSRIHFVNHQYDCLIVVPKITFILVLEGIQTKSFQKVLHLMLPRTPPCLSLFFCSNCSLCMFSPPLSARKSSHVFYAHSFNVTTIVKPFLDLCFSHHQTLCVSVCVSRACVPLCVIPLLH